MLELNLLGGAVLRRGDGELPRAATHRHSLALLALLASAPDRRLSRGKLVGLLWPEVTEHTARNRLSTTVHRLRKALGDDVLVSLGAGLRLNQERVDCDVCRFTAHLDAGDPTAAIDLYEGPFLDGFELRGSRAFDEWMERERDRLLRDYCVALESAAEEAAGAAEPAIAARWWQIRAREDPYDSRVTLRLMESLDAAGNRPEALRAFSEHARVLDEDLGTDASDATRALALRLREAAARPVAKPSRRLRPDEAAVPAVAVLPFEELGDGSASAFADGLHNDLLTRLSRLGGLKVISRTSVLRYRGSGASVPDIAAELGVDAIVEGSVQHTGGRIRLNVQLVEGRGDVHQWAETYDRTLTVRDLFDIQSELADRISRSVGRELTPPERKRVVEWTPTRDLEAYRLYVQGRARLDERTDQGMRRALELFGEAVARDEGYALAWVGSADALALLHEYGYEPADAVLPRAEEAARRALELDPDLAEAHASRGLLFEARREGLRAVQALERAVELQPGYADAHNWLSWTHQLLGRAARALEDARRAVALNPLSPEAVSNLANSSLINGDAPTALVEARRARELQPEWTTFPFYEALALFDLECYEEAGEVLEDLHVSWAGEGAEVTAALVQCMIGDTEGAHQRLAEYQDAEHHCAAGLIHAALGDDESAFASLSRIEEWSYWDTLSVHHYYPGVLGALRHDPRYRPIAERAHRAWGVNAD